MQRRVQLKRSRVLRKKRAEPRRSGRVRDASYMDWIRTLPCYVAVWRIQEWERIQHISWPEERCAAIEDWYKESSRACCWGPPTADHVGQRPLGRKCSDDETICLCARHHQDRQDYRGLWRGYNAGAMRAFNIRAIHWTKEQRRIYEDPDRSLAVAMGEEE